MQKLIMGIQKGTRKKDTGKQPQAEEGSELSHVNICSHVSAAPNECVKGNS